MDFIKPLIFSLKESVVITLIVLFLMVIVELLVLKYKNKIIKFIKNNKLIGYVVSSFFGIMPGCIGVFAMDTLYMSGLLGFGGIVSAMIATSGDETFMLISMAVKGEISWNLIFILISTLFVIGILGGYLADYIKKKTKLKLCEECKIQHHDDVKFSLKHFFKEHLVQHILKKHIWQIFLWLFVAIFVIELFQSQINFEVTGKAMFLVLIIASLIGLLPISGPNVLLIVLFAKGVIPFSVLLANSIIQDGHGLLPIIGFSIKDAIKIKTFNFVLGLTIGIILLSIGL